MPHARRHTRKKTPKRVLALPDLEHAARLCNAGDAHRLRLTARRVAGAHIGVGPAARRALGHRRSDRQGGHVRTVQIPRWVKAAVDAWTTAAAITEGRVIRAINTAGGSGVTGCRRRFFGMSFAWRRRTPVL